LFPKLEAISMTFRVYPTLRATLCVFASLLLAQDPLTNDAVLKMVKRV